MAAKQKYKKTARENQSARRAGTAKKTTPPKATAQNYKKTARENQSARRAGAAKKTAANKAKVTKAPAKPAPKKTTFPTSVNGVLSPLGRLQRDAKDKTQGVTAKELQSRVSPQLSKAIGQDLLRRRQAAAQAAQEKLSKTTDRRARAAYRQELMDAKHPVSGFDQKTLSTVEKQEIQRQKSLWDRGAELRKAGLEKAGRELQQAAHFQAEFQRARAGHSGGASGSDYLLPQLDPGEERLMTDQAKQQLRAQKRYYALAEASGNEELMRLAAETADAIRWNGASWDAKKSREARSKKPTVLNTDAHGRPIYTPTELEAEAQRSFFPAIGNQIKGSLLTLLETGNLATRNAIRNRNDAGYQSSKARYEELRRKADLERDPAEKARLEEAALEAKARAEAQKARYGPDIFSSGRYALRKAAEQRQAVLEAANNPFEKLVLEAVLSAGEMAPALAASALGGPAAGAAVMGAMAAGSKAGELRERGYSPEEALARGLVSGGIEGLTEKIPIGNLLKIVKGSGGATFLKNVAKQAGIEATEESASYALNFLADRAAKDPEASFSVDELLHSAAVGALSGAGFGTAGGVISGVNRTPAARPALPAPPADRAAQVREEAADLLAQEAPGKDVPKTATETARERYHRRYADLMARMQEAASDPAKKTDAVYAALTSEFRAMQEEGTKLVQQERREAGETSRNFGQAESHIDNRTAADLGDRGVKAFQFDHPQLHSFYAQAAEALKQDAAYSLDTQRSERGKGAVVRRSEPLAKAEAFGLTRNEIIRVCDDIIADKGQENYAAAKRVELVLDDMLSRGYIPNEGTTQADTKIPANEAYLQAKAQIPGAVTGFEAYKRQNALALDLGEVSEADLLAEYEAQEDPVPPASTRQGNAPAAQANTVQPRQAASAAHPGMVAEMAKTLGTSGGKAMQAAWDGRGNPAQYAADFVRVYNQALTGTSTGRIAAGGLNDAQVMAAYTAGQNDRQASLAAAEREAGHAPGAGKGAGLVQDDYVRTGLDRETASEIDAIARQLGVRVQMVDAVAGGKANAEIEGADIRIEKGNPNPVRLLLGHELTHRVQELSPKSYRAFRDFVMQAEGAQEAVRRKREAYKERGVDLSQEAAMDEFVADYAGEMIEDQDLLKQFIQKNKANRSILRRFLDAMKGLARKLTGSYQKKANDAVALLEQAVSDAAKQARKLPEAKNTARKGGARDNRFSIRYDKDNRPFVIIESDILDGVPKSKWVKTVKTNLAKRFPDGVRVGNNTITINSQSRREMTFSEYTKWLAKQDKSLYADKFRATNYANEIILASQGYINEGLKHARKDNIRDFARGGVLLRVGPSDYTADVVIGATSSGTMLLYDIVNIKRTRIEERSKRNIRPNNEEGHRRVVLASEDNLTQYDGDVKKKFSLKESAGAADGALEAILQKVQNGNKVQGREEDLRGVLQDAYDGKRTIDAIVKTFAGKGYKISTQTAKDIQALYREGRFSLKGADDYQGMLDQYGAFEQGEKPRARDVQVPRQTSDDKKVSRTVRTVMEAAVTPDAMVPTIQEMVAKGDFSYEVAGDKEAIASAEAAIKEKGFQSALIDWTGDLATGRVNKQNVATGWALYNAAAQAGDNKTAADILARIVQHQRNAAQAVQATRLLKKLAPGAQLYGIQRSVQSMQAELQDKYGDKAPDLKIPDDLVERYLSAETEAERTEAEKEIYTAIGKQMPSTFQDKWNAWRYLAMLLNARTHGRNILGNAFFALPVMTKNFVGTALEGVGSAVSGGKMQRTKGVYGPDLFSAAWKDYPNAEAQIMSGGKYDDTAARRDAIENGRQIFRFKLLEGLRKFNSGALEMEDGWFCKPHYANALAQYCAANKITAEQLRTREGLSAPDLDKARAYAIKEAQKATYRDFNSFSDFISSAGRYSGDNRVKKGFSSLVEGVLPFRKTPANILVRAIEYSPVGLADGIWELTYGVKAGKNTAAEALDRLSSGLTGSGLFALGVFLASQGLLTASGDDDDKQAAFDKLRGKQDYAIELPDGTNFTIDWLAPECIPVFMGAEYFRAMADREETGQFSLTQFLDAMSKVTNPLLEMSCLSSLNDLFDSLSGFKEGDVSSLVTVAAGMALSYLTQGVPTLFGQSERASQEERMTTYTDKNLELPADWQYQLGKLSGKLPGWDYNQIPYIDAWGRTENEGAPWQRILNNFLNPAYLSKFGSNAVETELQRLYDLTGENVLPQRASRSLTINGEEIDLNAEQYVRYATKKGQESLALLQEIISSDWYGSLGEAEKTQMILDAMTVADEGAKLALFPEYASKNKVFQKASSLKGEGVPVGTFLMLSGIAGAQDGTKTVDGVTVSDSKSYNKYMALKQSGLLGGLSAEQREKVYDAFEISAKIRSMNDEALSELGASIEEQKNAPSAYAILGEDRSAFVKEFYDTASAFRASYQNGEPIEGQGKQDKIIAEINKYNNLSREEKSALFHLFYESDANNPWA